jgi:prolyl 4-hydroxylase
MKPKKLNEEPWITWLRDELRLSRDFKEIHRMLRERGLSDQQIAAGLEMARPLDSALVQGNGRLAPPPLIRRAPQNLKRVDVQELELYTLENFLSAKECARIIALTSHHLIPSPVARDPGDAQYRTSKTCALAELRSPVALAIDEKISKVMGIRPSFGEGIQAQRYDVGGQFKPHCDYFEPGHTDYLRFASIRGNRTWTFMVYLNDGMEGGATRFVVPNYSVTPKEGMALLWNNLREDGTPNPDTKHTGEAVTKGYKVIITKWFRVMGEGSVFTG